MIKITEKPISPALVIDSVRNDSSGCVVIYVGLIRYTSQGKAVRSVELQDSKGSALKLLEKVADEAKQRFPVKEIAISRRVGKLSIGEINHVVAVSSAHRSEGFAACQYIVDQLKKRPPTRKVETYQDGSVVIQESLGETVG